MRRSQGSILAAALLVAIAPAIAEDAPVLRPTGAPPPGFEAFFDVQQTLVDVYYGGRFLRSVPARYDAEHVEFDEPELIVSALDGLLAPATVLAALSGRLDPNAQALCGRRATDACGRIEPEIAGVIFDASRFRATLFVAPDQLEARGPDVRRFLPPSDSGFSVLQNLFASASGADSATPDAYTVTGITSLAFAETHLLAETSYGSEDAFTLDQAYGRREFEGRAVQGGLYRTRGQSLSFVRETDLLGLQAGSSLETRADRAFSGGTPLQVFLPTRSRVEILQDGRLLDSGTYDAGNRVLDTRGLPAGAYEVTLRIRETGGVVREETRLFVKTTRLPPADQPLWTLEAGRRVDRTRGGALPADTGDWFARATTTRRIADGLGVALGLAGDSGDGLAEVGFYRLVAAGEVQASTFASVDGHHGAALLARGAFRTLRIDADARRIVGPELDRDRGDRTSLVGNAIEQYGLRVSSPFLGGVLSLAARHDAIADGDDRTSQSLSWDRYLLRSGRGTLRLEVDLSREDDDTFGLIRLAWDLRGERGWRGAVQPGLRYDETDGAGDFALQTDARAGWEREFAGGDRVLVGVDGTQGDAEQRLGLSGDYQGRAGRLRADIDRNFADDRTIWTGNLNTSLLTDGERVSVGGRDRARSAALVEIRGDVPDARFEVLVDGYARGVAPAGSVTAIHLAPWQTYTVRLRPLSDGLLAWENREEQITLYPGNVVRLGWQVSEIVVVLGRVRDEAGAPVEQARVDGAYGFAMTEAGGWLQAEAVRPAPGTPLRFVLSRRDAEDCTVTVPADVVAADDGIVRLGSLVCR